MKNVNKLAVLISLAALLAPALKAKSPEQAYLDSCRKDAGVPVPIVVVTPSVSSTHVGQMVEIAFTVNANGTVSEFSVKSSPDAALAENVMDAVKQWKFRPAVSGGVAVATKVVLPVTIAEDRAFGTRFAAK